MHLKQSHCLYFVSLSLFLLLFSCGKKKEEAKALYSELLSVNGTVHLIRDNEKKALEKGAGIQSGDIIVTEKNSSAAVSLHTYRVIHLKENSKVSIEYSTEEKSNDLSFSLALSNGEMYSELLSTGSGAVACAVTSPTASIVGNESSFSVSYYTKNNLSVVKAFVGPVSIFPTDRKGFDVPACQKVLIKNDGTVSRLVSIDNSDFEELSGWVGKDKVAAISSAAGCMEEQVVEENLPPVWKSEPKTTCKPGKAFIDQLSAEDPEGSAVQYSLITAPKGMKISATGGVIHYNPQYHGTFEVQVTASDDEGNTAELSYHLTVIGELSAVLKIPQVIKINTPYKIDASRSVDGMGKKRGLQFRFDIDNNGVWDYPKSGNFGTESSATHAYEKPGTYTVKVEVKDESGDVTVKMKQLDVIVPLELQITFDPPFGTVGTEYTLSVKPSAENETLPEGSVVRWDLNGDNRWDFPTDGGFTDEITIKHMWDKAGTYNVVAEVKDKHKTLTTTSSEVVVFKGVTVESLEGPDTVFINKKFTYTCKARDPDFEITEYEWGSAGVGMFGEKSPEPSTEISYDKAGTFTLICSATNEKGMSATATKDIVVFSYSTIVNAGGPYKTNINVPVTLQGTAQDVDNEVVTYFWDFNNDKKNDWNSAKTSKTTHTFNKKGTYIVRFSVKTDDGKITEDTALVSVGNHPPEAFAGEDILSRKNKKVKLSGLGKDPDDNIVKYEWDFNGDGTYDWSSKDTGYTVHEFAEYASAVLKVTDSEGASATDTINIVICPKGMRAIEGGNFCIDKYEWPNKKGKTPMVNVSFTKAESECRKIGKRLCSAEEMKMACQGGKERYEYPYGKRYVADNCNTFGNRHTENQVAKSGEFPECQSRYGVFDMSGNVAEWTTTSKGKMHYVVGGWWQDDDSRAKCNSYILLNKNKQYMYVGFRCCK